MEVEARRRMELKSQLGGSGDEAHVTRNEIQDKLLNAVSNYLKIGRFSDIRWLCQDSLGSKRSYEAAETIQYK